MTTGKKKDSAEEKFIRRPMARSSSSANYNAVTTVNTAILFPALSIKIRWQITRILPRHATTSAVYRIHYAGHPARNPLPQDTDNSA